MTKADANKLELGIYQIFWKSGGWSLAAVGERDNGDRWYAPTNWIDPAGRLWGQVQSVKLIATKPRGVLVYHEDDPHGAV